MTTPIRLRCKSTSAIPSNDEIRSMTHSEHHVVLEFPVKLKVDKSPIIARLKESLPEHSVFDSGGNRETDCVTVMPVINTSAILANSAAIKKAVALYIEACSTLLASHNTGNHSSEWTSYVHGGHRRFENSATGQIVEAPLSGLLAPRSVDPYFFSQFVKTSSNCEAVVKIIKDDFHDAARIMDVLFRSAAL